MYGNKSKNLEQYQKSEGSYNTVKSGNQVIFGILNKHFTKSLTAIYALQTSLNFDSNNKLAINLFQIYEYCRQQLIKGYSKKVVKDIIKAANAIKNILSSFEEGLSNA